MVVVCRVFVSIFLIFFICISSVYAVPGTSGGTQLEPAHNPAGNTDLVAECGTAHGKTYSLTESGYGSDTFCSQGAYGNPYSLSPLFPGAGQTMTWSCWANLATVSKECSASRAGDESKIITPVCSSFRSSTVSDFLEHQYCDAGRVSGLTYTEDRGIISKYSWSCLAEYPGVPNYTGSEGQCTVGGGVGGTRIRGCGEAHDADLSSPLDASIESFDNLSLCNSSWGYSPLASLESDSSNVQFPETGEMVSWYCSTNDLGDREYIDVCQTSRSHSDVIALSGIKITDFSSGTSIEADNVPSRTSLALTAQTEASDIKNVHFRWTIDGEVFSEGFGADEASIEYSFERPETEVIVEVIRDNDEVSVKKITAKYPAFSIEGFEVLDPELNDEDGLAIGYPLDKVPYDKEVVIYINNDQETLSDVTLTWFMNDVEVKQGVGAEYGYLEIQGGTGEWSELSASVKVTAQREGEEPSEAEVTIVGIPVGPASFEDHPAIGAGITLTAEDGTFDQGSDNVGDYYTPTSKSLSVYKTADNTVIANISLTDPSKVKIYTRKIISLDPSALITFTDKNIPLFEGKFIIEDEVLRNSLIVESYAQDYFSELDEAAQCERIYGSSADVKKKTQCLEARQSGDRAAVNVASVLSQANTPVTDATLLMGTDSDDVGLSPALMATPYVWDAQVDLSKEKVKLTALVSPASVFNFDGNDYSLLDVGSTTFASSMLLAAKGIKTLPFTYTMESDGSTTTEIGKSNLQFQNLLLELKDSKSISWESKLETDSESASGFTRKNTIKIKKAKGRIYENFDAKKLSNFEFDVVNAKVEYIDGQYQLKSYEAGAAINIPEIPLGTASKIKNASLGVYFVGRSSIDDENWPVAFTDEHLLGSKFYMYFSGSGELITTAKDTQHSLDVKFKVIPGPIAHYENFLMLSGSVNYEKNSIKSLSPSKGFQLTDIRGALKYQPEVDDFAWKVGAGAWVGNYHGIASVLFKNPNEDNFTLGAIIDSLSYRPSNIFQVNLGKACLLGGSLTPSLVEFAECPKFTNSCSTTKVLQKDAVIASGTLFRLKADPAFKTRKDGSKDWKSLLGPGIAQLELGYKVIVDDLVKSGKEEGVYVSGGGAASLSIPASKSKIFPFPIKPVVLLNACLGFSPFDLTYYYEEGFFSNVEKVQNVKNMFGLYATSSTIFSNKEMSVFFSFEPFQLADEDEERVFLVGTDFTIDLKDNLQGRQMSARSSFIASREVSEGVVKELLTIPDGDSGPIIVISNVPSVTVTTPSGLVLTESDIDAYEFIDIVQGDENVSISLSDPEGGEWTFEFDDVAGNEFTVLTQNKAPTASATLVSSQAVYGQPLSVQLDYLDSDSERGFIKLVAKKDDESSTLYEDELDLTAALENIDVQLPAPGAYELVLEYTDGMRGYIETSLGAVESTLPNIQVNNLVVKATSDSVVAEWQSDDIIETFEVLITNDESGVTNRFNTVEPSFNLAGLVASDYSLQVNALFESQTVASSSEGFTISEVAECAVMAPFSISNNFSDGYAIAFNQGAAEYFEITIQSITNNQSSITEKVISPSYDLSAYIGHHVDITVRAVNQCGNEVLASSNTLVSNEFDVDSDGLFDDWEQAFFDSLIQNGDNDFDQDGISNRDELASHLNPSLWDSDGDKVADNEDPNPLRREDQNANSLPDDWESFHQVSDLAADPDGDSLTNYDEYFVNGNPNVFDADLTLPEFGLGPVIQTDKDQSHIISVALSDTINLDASNSIDTAKGSLNYAWCFNDQVISTEATIAYIPELEGWGSLKLTTTNTDGISASRSWAVLVSSSAINSQELTLGTTNEVINYAGLQFSLPETLSTGNLFVGELLTSDLPELPDGYTLVGDGGLMLSLSGGGDLSEQMSIVHVSTDILMMYSTQKSAWGEVASEGRSAETDKLGIFALFTKDESETTNSTGTSGSVSEQTGGGCFIATAAYGSYLQSDVQILRDFRDNYLLTNQLGTEFVRVYYELSPPIAEFIAQHDVAKLFVRALLVVVIFIVQHFIELLLLMLLAYYLRVYLSVQFRQKYVYL